MNPLRTECPGCGKGISAHSLDLFKERAVRHVRNCNGVKALAVERIPRWAPLRFGRALWLLLRASARRLWMRIRGAR